MSDPPVGYITDARGIWHPATRRPRGSGRFALVSLCKAAGRWEDAGEAPAAPPPSATVCPACRSAETRAKPLEEF